MKINVLQNTPVFLTLHNDALACKIRCAWANRLLVCVNFAKPPPTFLWNRARWVCIECSTFVNPTAIGWARNWCTEFFRSFASNAWFRCAKCDDTFACIQRTAYKYWYSTELCSRIARAQSSKDVAWMRARNFTKPWWIDLVKFLIVVMKVYLSVF